MNRRLLNPGLDCASRLTQGTQCPAGVFDRAAMKPGSKPIVRFGWRVWQRGQTIVVAAAYYTARRRFTRCLDYVYQSWVVGDGGEQPQ